MKPKTLGAHIWGLIILIPYQNLKPTLKAKPSLIRKVKLWIFTFYSYFVVSPKGMKLDPPHHGGERGLFTGSLEVNKKSQKEMWGVPLHHGKGGRSSFIDLR